MLQKVLPLEFFNAVSFTIEEGTVISHADLVKKFTNCNYLQVPVVQNSGEMAVRGSVIDFFPFASDLPLRIELENDTIKKFKTFDIDSQITIQDAGSCAVLPVREYVNFRNLKFPFADFR